VAFRVSNIVSPCRRNLLDTSVSEVYTASIFRVATFRRCTLPPSSGCQRFGRKHCLHLPKRNIFQRKMLPLSSGCQSFGGIHSHYLQGVNFSEKYTAPVFGTPKFRWIASFLKITVSVFRVPTFRTYTLPPTSGCQLSEEYTALYFQGN
jgi:hypothetical protein